jgi:hypothetical protein
VLVSKCFEDQHFEDVTVVEVVVNGSILMKRNKCNISCCEKSEVCQPLCE